MTPEPKCSNHPDAPHGFNRNASHNADRYICDCEGWIPPEKTVVYTKENDMQDFITVIELLQQEIRTLDYLSTPTKNTVTEHFAKENIAKAVVIHAAIDVLKNASFPAGERKIYAWRNPINGVVISNDKKQDLLSVGQGYPNFSEPLYTKEF